MLTLEQGVEKQLLQDSSDGTEQPIDVGLDISMMSGGSGSGSCRCVSTFLSRHTVSLKLMFEEDLSGVEESDSLSLCPFFGEFNL